jgi:hypothetical protein
MTKCPVLRAPLRERDIDVRCHITGRVQGGLVVCAWVCVLLMGYPGGWSRARFSVKKIACRGCQDICRIRWLRRSFDTGTHGNRPVEVGHKQPAARRSSAGQNTPCHDLFSSSVVSPVVTFAGGNRGGRGLKRLILRPVPGMVLAPTANTHATELCVSTCVVGGPGAEKSTEWWC